MLFALRVRKLEKQIVNMTNLKIVLWQLPFKVIQTQHQLYFFNPASLRRRHGTPPSHIDGK